jgi:hypothetical protein
MPESRAAFDEFLRDGNAELSFQLSLYVHGLQRISTQGFDAIVGASTNDLGRQHGAAPSGAAVR